VKWAAVVVAAGRGTRFGGPKQLVEIAGVPMVALSVRTFAAMAEVAEIIVATEEESIEPMRELFERVAPGRVRVVRGGATRQRSVAAGLSAAGPDCEGVLVHDGARPLVLAQDVRAGMSAVRDGRASLLAAPIVDTVKRVADDSLRVVETLDRTALWAAQTPQFATAADMRAAHARALRDNVDATDDAALLEANGVEVVVVGATGPNFKVTLPDDVARAEALLRERSAAAGR
jgi:2-C-methyl-D-erythritol 4-phosphate cytidylyltransferase